jgi:hypothetical protein
MKCPSTLSTSTQPGSPVLTVGVICSLSSEGSLALTDLTLCETNRPHSYQKGEELTNLRTPLQRLNRDELARTSISLIPFHSLPVYPLDPQIRMLFSPHPPAVRQIPTVTFSRSLQHKRFYPPIHEGEPDEIRRQSMTTLHNTPNS